VETQKDKGPTRGPISEGNLPPKTKANGDQKLEREVRQTRRTYRGSARRGEPKDPGRGT